MFPWNGPVGSVVADTHKRRIRGERRPFSATLSLVSAGYNSIMQIAKPFSGTMNIVSTNATGGVSLTMVGWGRRRQPSVIEAVFWL